MRQKDASMVLAEADAFIRSGGYREISLSSLSTGDYRHIDALLEELNRIYGPSHVSFQLPSLRVSTFSLSILEKVSAVRRSGLTFAVETPVDAWQLAINKEVSRDSVIAILKEARKNGWRGAKFYFMVGLPVGGPDGCIQDGTGREEEEIVAFIRDVARRTGMNFNINAGAFVPKPHTPFQWAAQIDEDTAREKLEYIRRNLKTQGHKVGIQDPFISVLEGVISRGDERVGDLIAEAFDRGCRLDAWDDYIRKDVWRGIFDRERSLVETILGKKETGVPLPWNSVNSGTGLRFLEEEAGFSSAGRITPPCVRTGAQNETPACGHPCGICPIRGRIIENATGFGSSPETETGNPEQPSNPSNQNGDVPGDTGDSVRDPATYRILFSFAKSGPAVWLPHLAVIEVFAMALQRAAIPVQFSEGFNPLPKLDFASPISIGVSAEGEIATVDTAGFFDALSFTERLNPQLPEGFRVNQALNVYIPSGMKKHSAASLLWGFAYETPGNGAIGAEPDFVAASGEKRYRQERLAAGESLFGLIRKSVLAKARENPTEPLSYFNVYRDLYNEREKTPAVTPPRIT
jgi:radical SAM-linked protein